MVLEFKDVSYKYFKDEDFVIKNVNFQFKPGTFYLLIGPTGSGKTTLLKLARGFYKDYGGDFRGDILLDGKSIKSISISEIGNKIAIILQSPATQLHQLRVIDEIMSPFIYRGIPWNIAKRKAEELIKLIGKNFCNRNPQELSSGEQQKVSLIACLAMDCNIFLLDEPFSFISSSTAEELIKVLVDLKKKGKTIILAAHNVEQIAKYADEIIILNDGQVKMHGSPKKILYNSEFEKILHPPLFVKLTKELINKKILNVKVLSWEELSHKFKLQNLCKRDTVVKKNIILELKNVSYNYPDRNRGIRNINLEVHEGEIVGLLGDNGSGKTTLAKTIVGLLKPIKGDIFLLGQKIQPKVSEMATHIGYVTQDPNDMIFETSVLKECAFGPKIRGEKADESKAVDVLKKLGLEIYKEKHPGSLSYGQRKLLSIADILVNNPKILILDEPECGLDMEKWRTVESAIKNLVKDGKSIIITTHNLFITPFLCDRIALMKNGEILKVGSPADIYSQKNILKEAGFTLSSFFEFLKKSAKSEEEFVANIVAEVKNA